MTDHQAFDETGSTTPELPEAPQGAVALIAQLFDHWGLSAGDRQALLGRPACADDAAVASSDSAELTGHLLAIHARLRRLFPQNRDLACAWMGTENKAFDGRAPVAVARDEGIVGLRIVRVYLDHAIGG